MIFIQYVINGLIIGGAYALIGIGLTLILGIMKVVNFAHGEMYMLGAYFLFTFFSKMGIQFLPRACSWPSRPVMVDRVRLSKRGS